jgi:TRAP-type C4-dicarboxylate transport system permease small subunit
METFLLRYRLLLVSLGKIERLLGVALLGAIVVAIILQVFFRYVMQNPLVWVMEFSSGCFIWGTFLCVSYALKKNRHITLNSLTAYLPDRVRAFLRATAYLLIIILCVIMIAKAVNVINVEGRSTTVSLPIMIPKSWLFSIPVFLSAILSLFTCFYLMLAEIRAAISGKAAEPILAS